MKKRILALLTAAAMVITMMPAMVFAETETTTSVNIEINETNFPDEKFRAIVNDLDEYDDGVLMDKEINETQHLNVDDEGISDLTGIQYFTNLKELYCDDNQLTSLDLSGLTELAVLGCSNNQLASLNIKDCPSLVEVRAHHNHLTMLELNPDAGYHTIHVQYNDFADQSAIKLNGNTMEWAMEYAFHPQNWVKPLEINAANFPDPELRKALTRYDYNKDNILSPGEITDIYSIDLNNSGVEDLTGIQHLIVLEDLDCTACYLTQIPELPKELKELYVTYNYLTELPELPDTLEKLWCYDNMLTSLPELPDSLKMLYCEKNQLTELPELPDSITYLNCDSNNLTELPELPASLEELWCSYNQLEQLPELPAEIELLYCWNNKLTELPELPDSVIGLQCSENNIKMLPELPSKLQTLYAHKNEIDGVLDLSQLRFLSYVDVSNNRITGIKLNPYAKYGSMWVSDNAMKSEADVTGRSDIVWGENGYYFGRQKSACELNGHTYGSWIVDRKATCEKSGLRYKKCECGDRISETIAATGHKWGSKYTVDKAATTAAAGSKSKHCTNTNCNAIKSGTTVKIAKIKNTTASTLVYNGKNRTPNVTVTNANGKKLVKGTDFTVTYKNLKGKAVTPKAVGGYKVVVKFKGDYSGSVTKEFKINPQGTAIKTLTKGKNHFTAKWKKNNVQVTGYQIRYSTKQNMNSAKTVLVKKAGTTAKTVKQLKSKKKYWVQIRTYKTVNGTKYYSAWSAKKSVTTK